MKNLKITLAAASMACALAVAAQEYQVPVSEAQEPMQQGKFQPTWESLSSQYQVPEWFRDAKFGIWAHWGPQCVEGSGDWMARSLYLEGSREYKHHVENYGHPSEVGFKDIIPLFTAENWDPDYLVGLYKKVGAQYFFALGNHHDNFDLWDSKYQPWNSQNMGPKRDLLDGWAKAAKKHGLPFGISFHADHAWTWYEPSQRYDRGGHKMAVPYDGNLTKADGKGKWWEGYDPQDLYAQNHPLSEGTWADGMIHRQWGWNNGVCVPSQEYVTKFYNRTIDAINRYNPDLIYFDVIKMPFHPISDAGLKIAAHHYNHNIANNNGDNRAVFFAKVLDGDERKAIVWDVERGAPNEIMETPWQCCTCIGGWHYDQRLADNGWYKSAGTVVRMLIDIVSKNGNMLLSIPLRGDGTFDEKEEAILNEIGDWMAVNGESIFKTRPWVIFGEGPVADSNIEVNVFGFNEDAYKNPTSSEIRFTQTPKYIYATALRWPEDGKVVIKALGKDSKHYKKNIKNVELLGYGKVKCERTADGLVVNLPTQPTNTIAPVLRIKK